MPRQIGRGKSLRLALQRRQRKARRRLVDQRRGQDARIDAEAGVKPRRQQREHRRWDQEGPTPLGHSAAWTRASTTGRGRRAGAPIRWRRSVSETSPPSAIAAAPSQIHGTSGL